MRFFLGRGGLLYRVAWVVWVDAVEIISLICFSVVWVAPLPASICESSLILSFFCSWMTVVCVCLSLLMRVIDLVMCRWLSA